MPLHQGWPFWRRKGPQKENTQGFTGRVELEVLTSPGLWQTDGGVREGPQKKHSHTRCYKILVTNSSDSQRREEKPKTQVRLKNWIPKKKNMDFSKLTFTHRRNILYLSLQHTYVHKGVCVLFLLSISPGIVYAFHKQNLICLPLANHN